MMSITVAMTDLLVPHVFNCSHGQAADWIAFAAAATGEKPSATEIGEVLNGLKAGAKGDAGGVSVYRSLGVIGQVRAVYVLTG